MNPSLHPGRAWLVSALLCLNAQAAADRQSFDQPDQAAAALVQAAAAFDVPALKRILGPDCEDIVSSEDPVMDKQRAVAFAAKAKQKLKIESDAADAAKATITVGEDSYPLPIPLIKDNGKWTFDTRSGRDEILRRNIGANELDAIAICRLYVSAQHQYAAIKHDGATVHQYAQRILSSPGKQDGLAWQGANGAWEGPLGEGVAKALEQGYVQQVKPQPYHGYHFKVLKGQGPDAPLGSLDFVIHGAMIGGFALAAAPAEYGVTGVKSFIVSHSGTVYEKDLGPDTVAAFAKLELFNPDSSWVATEDRW
ncbi:MAG TPA: DUF2950 domain-containing protein [Luteolibacter sp.]|nr:DUF2950 domain-containing protein [Luteolibacter sp.]